MSIALRRMKWMMRPTICGGQSPLVGAVVLRLALVAHQRRAAFGAYGDVFERFAVRRPLREVYPRDLGDDLAALLDVYHVARGGCPAGPSARRCAASHACTVVPASSTGSRFATGVMAPVRPTWNDDAQSSSRERLLGLELVGHGPFRGLGRESQLPPLRR